MNSEFTIYVNEVERVEIERVPDRHLVRIVIKGAEGDTDDARLSCWSRFDKPGAPEVVVTDKTEEPAHDASDVAGDANG